MCTSLALPTPRGTNLFGRTLDLDAHFGERVTLTPRRYSFTFADCYPHTHHYALLGMAAVTDVPTASVPTASVPTASGPAASSYPLYAEAMNEKGLCMAGLRFAKSAVYAPAPRVGWLNLAPWELIPYLLGTCATVAEARAALGDICVVDKPFSDGVGTAPLHWHIVDADPTHGGLILEVTAEGMKVYPDHAGVLTNDPPYPEQLAALRACPVLRGDQPGLPGDYSSPSRFTRAATLRRWWTEQGSTCETAVEAVFLSILGAVSPTPGAVITPEGTCHRTLYTCCMDTAAGIYRYTTEWNGAVREVSFDRYDLNRENIPPAP